MSQQRHSQGSSPEEVICRNGRLCYRHISLQAQPKYDKEKKQILLSTTQTTKTEVGQFDKTDDIWHVTAIPWTIF